MALPQDARHVTARDALVVTGLYCAVQASYACDNASYDYSGYQDSALASEFGHAMRHVRRERPGSFHLSVLVAVFGTHIHTFADGRGLYQLAGFV